MDIIETGVLIKSLLICILGLFLILLIIQIVKLDKNYVRNTKILYSVLISFGLVLNFFDIFTIVKTSSLIIPVIDLYHNMIRLILVVLFGVFLIITGIRLIIYLTKQTVPEGTHTRGAYAGVQGSISRFVTPKAPQEPPRTTNLSDIKSPKVNVRWMLVSTICYAVVFVISVMSRPIQRSFDLAWIVIEIVEILFWIFLSVTIMVFKQQNQNNEQIQPIKV